MLKKTVAALFGLVFAMVLIAPPKANAEVVVGVRARAGYGYVAVRQRPYVYVVPAPYVAYAPGYVYPPVVYPGRVVVEHGYRYDGRHGHEWRR